MKPENKQSGMRPTTSTSTPALNVTMNIITTITTVPAQHKMRGPMPTKFAAIGERDRDGEEGSEEEDELAGRNTMR